MAQPDNNNFTKFLAAYGPWDNGNSKYNEYVESFAQSCGETSFDFEIPKQRRYFKRLEQLLSDGKSHLVLITGNAGDGKTHFLQQGLNRFAAGSEKKFDIQKYAEQYHNGDDRLLPIPLSSADLTVVKDLSDTDNASHLVEPLFKIIQFVLDQYADSDSVTAPAPASLPSPSANSDFNHKPQVVLIAGNNGKLLECFKDKLLKRAGAHNYTSLIADLEHILLGDHSNSDYLEKCGIVIFDMASCLDEETVRKVFPAILNHEKWHNCEGCKHQGKCSIYHNLKVLRHDMVQQRFVELFHLIHDEGEHLTMRSLLMVLANAILGREKGGRNNGYWTCSKVAYSSAANMEFSHPFDNIFGRNLFSDDKKKIDIPVYQQFATLEVGEHTSKLFDAFLLSCVDPQKKQAVATAVVQTPSPFAYQPYGHMLAQAQAQESPEVQEFLDNAEVQKLLTSLKSDLERYKNNQDSYDDADFENSELGKIQLSLQKTMIRLRRAAFFTLKQAPKSSPYGYGYGTSTGPTTTSCLDPYALTAFSYGQIYLSTAKALKAQFSGSGEYFNFGDITKPLLIGLNRAFTHLMSNDTDDLFVSTNNKLNPTAFCVLYYGMRTELNQNPERPRDDKVRLTLNVINDDAAVGSGYGYRGEALSSNVISEAVPVLRYTPDQDLHQPQVPVQIDLKLTPKMFEYLMALADGSMAISFSHECHEDINAFKDNITVAKNTISQRHATTDIRYNLSNIRICALSSEGKIV